MLIEPDQNLSPSDWGSARIAHFVRNIRGLEKLCLEGTAISNTGMRDLISLRLSELDLSSTQVSDGGIGLAGRISSLTRLRVVGSLASPEALSALQTRLPGLEIIK